MTLTVLSDEQVKGILENLTLDELEDFRRTLAEALHAFSTSLGTDGLGVFQQPHRVSTLHPETRATTLYMPSCGPSGMGCKVVSLTSAEASKDPSVQAISPTGVVNLFSPDGKAIGLVHASTLTAFRTALASLCLVYRRNHVRTITVFGSGMQAYWHVRLALMMRGSTVRHVNIINHRFSDSAGRILKKFAVIPHGVKAREGWETAKFTILTPTFHEFARLQKEYIRNADIIYCCTPSRQDLFEASILTSHEGRKKGRLIVAVGSYTPEMRELPEALLQLVTKPRERGHRHFHRHADEGGVIVVDTLDGVLAEAGEIMAARIPPTQLVELGELVMLHRMAVDESESEASEVMSQGSSFSELDLADRTPSASTAHGDLPPSPSSPMSSGRKSPFSRHFRKTSSTLSEREKEKSKDDGLSRWLRDGTVVYKSVGTGLMDLVVGTRLVEVAKQKNIGTQIEGF
ncbi:nadp-binding domain [Trichoderma cornu-damae]|uniref:Nadp-binding domain n=1 Tax=Trichoderma cornu-damae TaxID=654480 RepID=A0A9P8QTP3_9HYPO|nr:nadp-binding domain [Trichoderma cornu-damae]